MKLMKFLEKEGVKSLTDTNVDYINLFDKPKYAVYSYATNNAVHSFIIVKVSGEENDLYYEYDDDGANEFSKDINLADVYLYGSVKWDGCSNWIYPEQTENYMTHFCSVEEACLFAEIMKLAYNIASQQINGFEG